MKKQVVFLASIILASTYQITRTKNKISHKISQNYLLDSHKYILTASIAPITGDASSDFLKHIAVRFYYIQRLGRYVKFLKAVTQKSSLKEHLVHDFFQEVDESACVFTNKKVVHCIRQLQIAGDFLPVLELWEDIEHFQMIDDHTIIKEFSCLIFCFFKELVHKNIYARHAPEGVEIATILQLTTPLEVLSTEQILEILDLVIEQLPHFIDTYELSSGLSFNTWFKKYWLVAPIALGLLGLKI